MNISNKVFEIKKDFLARQLKKQTEWLDWQDKLLMETYKIKKAKIWINCSTLLKDKSAKECMKRFKKINYLNKKGRWTKEEDQKLNYLVNKFGKNWILFAKVFSNRNTKQIRIRYNEHLDVRLNLKPLTEKEDNLLLGLYQKNLESSNNEDKKLKQNVAWKEIRRNFPNRPFTRLKRRLIAILRNQRMNSNDNFLNGDVKVNINTSSAHTDIDCYSNSKSESFSFPLRNDNINHALRPHTPSHDQETIILIPHKNNDNNKKYSLNYSS